MVWAKLGNITFEPIQGFDRFDVETGVEYARHGLIQSKPDLEPTGISLTVIPVVMSIYFLHGVTPEQRISDLNTAMYNNEVLKLVFDNGRNYGDFVIEKVRVRNTQTDPSGYLVHVEVEVDLVEYVVPDKADARLRSAQLYAIGNKGSAGLPPAKNTLIPNTAQSASLATLQAGSQVQTLNKQSRKLTPANLAKNVREIQKNLSKISEYARRAQTIVTAAQNLPNSPNAATALLNVWQATDAFNQTIPTATVSQIQDYNKQVSTLYGSASGAMTNIAALVGVRRVF